MANYLRSLGHRTVFLFLDPIENNLKENGHEVYDCTTEGLEESKSIDTAQDKWNSVIMDCREIWQSGDVIANYEQELKLGFYEMVKDIYKYNSTIEKKVDLLKPDLIVIDHYFAIPALFKHSTTWIRIFSATPLSLHSNPDLPPACLGLPTNWNKNDEKQQSMVERAHKAKKLIYDEYNAYWRSNGMDKDLPTEPISFIPLSPWLNLYMYPEELDYYKEYPLKDWQRCDSMVRDAVNESKFEIPESLKDKPGKLIFLSLGSLASAEIGLMQRLTSMLADCPHRFIVTKGPLHDKYELPPNMWGQKFVKQLQVLKSVDLVITHGGNNTITECFFLGVPGFIICPLFADQFDNAQRIEEKGLGLRLDPYNCTKEELLNAIEQLLSNKEIPIKMKAISERMQHPETRKKAITLVGEVVAKL